MCKFGAHILSKSEVILVFVETKYKETMKNEKIAAISQ